MLPKFIAKKLMVHIPQSITANLVTKGNLSSPLILYNRTLQHAVNQSRRIGYSLVAKSLQEAVAKADIIWLCLQSQEAVEHTFAEIFSTADNSLTDKLFIESSTVNPDLSNNLAERVVEAGGEYVAMPGKTSQNLGLRHKAFKRTREA